MNNRVRADTREGTTDMYAKLNATAKLEAVYFVEHYNQPCDMQYQTNKEWLERSWNRAIDGLWSRNQRPTAREVIALRSHYQKRVIELTYKLIREDQLDRLLAKARNYAKQHNLLVGEFAGGHRTAEQYISEVMCRMSMRLSDKQQQESSEKPVCSGKFPCWPGPNGWCKCQ